MGKRVYTVPELGKNKVQAKPKFVSSFLMHTESLLTLDETTLYDYDRRLSRGCNLTTADVVGNWVANVEPPSESLRPASRASETVSDVSSSMLELDVHMPVGNISDDDELDYTEREHVVMSPPKRKRRRTRPVFFFQRHIVSSSNFYLSLRAW